MPLSERKPDAREAYRERYAHLLDRLTNAMRMSPEQQREWGATIEDLARQASEERARYLQVTPRAADARLGTVLEVATGIVECERASKTNLTETLEALGAVIA